MLPFLDYSLSNSQKIATGQNRICTPTKRFAVPSSEAAKQDAFMAGYNLTHGGWDSILSELSKLIDQRVNPSTIDLYNLAIQNYVRTTLIQLARSEGFNIDHCLDSIMNKHYTRIASSIIKKYNIAQQLLLIKGLEEYIKVAQSEYSSATNGIPIAKQYLEQLKSLNPDYDYRSVIDFLIRRSEHYTNKRPTYASVHFYRPLTIIPYSRGPYLPGLYNDFYKAFTSLFSSSHPEYGTYGLSPALLYCLASQVVYTQGLN